MPYAAVAERNCVQCGSSFAPHSPNGKFCSQECYWAQRRTSAMRGPKPVRNCNNCGDAYKQMGPRQLHCRKSTCHWLDHEANVLHPWREQQERILVRLEDARTRRRERERLRRLLSGEDHFGGARWRAEKEAESRDTVDAARARDGELAALIDDQSRDAAWGHRVDHRWILWLDAPLGDTDLTLGQQLSEWDSDPMYALLRSEHEQSVRAATGGLSEDELGRLSEHDLRRLRDKLYDAGLVQMSLSQSDHRRLAARRKPIRPTGHHMSNPEFAFLPEDLHEHGHRSGARKQAYENERRMKRDAKVARRRAAKRLSALVEKEER